MEPIATPRSQPADPSPLALALGRQLTEARDRLAHEWLERIVARVTMPVDYAFPTNELLEHVPRLIEGIAHYVEEPSKDLANDGAVEAEATALGQLRHAQGFAANQILKEYELLGDILFRHLADGVDRIAPPCTPRELLLCARNLFHAIAAVEETTTLQFLRLADARVMDRESRLRAFARMVSHELRNDLGVILAANDMLDSTEPVGAAKRKELQTAVSRRAKSMKATLDRLLELARVDVEAHTPRRVQLLEVIEGCVAREEERAKESRVELRIAAAIPEVEVNAAVVEFALANYLSNAIKYSRRGAADALIEVKAMEIDGRARRRREVVVCVKDNGIGIAPERRSHLFERFYRANTENSAEGLGLGLGLSLVREMIESVGGCAWAEFPDRHTVFSFTLPVG